jgi:diadenosine tetraphosphate (Ap4A) HIT family hydrolase
LQRIVVAGLDPAIHADVRLARGFQHFRGIEMSVWSLHPQLENDTTTVGDLALCRVLAIDDADYPWLVLVPRRTKHDPEKWEPVFGKDHASSYVTEIADLGADAAVLMDEILHASRVLKDVTGCDKLNIAAIGNVVPQLHVHIVARWINDPLWPKPVWGAAPPRHGDLAAFARLVATMRDRLGIDEPNSFSS